MNDVVPARGSLRSRGAAAVSAITIRPVSGLVPPERAWGIWLSRQIIARVMSTFGPSLAGTRVEQVDTVLPDGRRVRGEWVYGPPTPTSEARQARSSNGAGPMHAASPREQARSSNGAGPMHAASPREQAR